MRGRSLVPLPLLSLSLSLSLFFPHHTAAQCRPSRRPRPSTLQLEAKFDLSIEGAAAGTSLTVRPPAHHSFLTPLER